MKRAILLGLVLLMGGCEAQTRFRLAAIEELGETLIQLERGATESQAGLLTRCNMREGQVRSAAAVDLTGIANDGALDEAAKTAAVQAKLLQLWKIQEDVDTDRVRGTQRFRLMAQWGARGRLVLAHMMALEQQNQTTEQKLAEYKTLAELYARKALGLELDRPVPVSTGGAP